MKKSNTKFATINVQSGSYYAKFNGQEFPIVDQLNTRVSLSVNGITTDFLIEEVIILPDVTPGQLKLLHSIWIGLRKENAHRPPYYDTYQYVGRDIPNYSMAVSQTRLHELHGLGVLRWKNSGAYTFVDEFIITELGQKVLEKYFPETVA